jgi:hypothetical protein
MGLKGLKNLRFIVKNFGFIVRPLMNKSQLLFKTEFTIKTKDYLFVYYLSASICHCANPMKKCPADNGESAPR